MPSAATPQWDNETKTLDRERPFHRVRYKDFDATGVKPKADGDGLSCGCSPQDEFKEIESTFLAAAFDKGFLRDVLGTLLGKGVDGIDKIFSALAKLPGMEPLEVVGLVFAAAKDMLLETAKKLHAKAVRVIPQWVPVKKGSPNDVIDATQVVEIEGFVTRGYQNAIETPLSQWRHFYAWSLHIRPERGYEWVEAVTPNPPSTKDLDDLGDDKDDMESPERPIVQKGSVECQWDGGALWQDRSLFERDFPDDIEANTFNKAAERACGPMFQTDWAWPMTGQYAWASGRWVFDCSKSTKTESKDKKPGMRTLLHPCKAVATARWEAFKFSQNEGRVPAIQFMFFASKRGGYLDYGQIDDQDYEFIVDLPEVDGDKTEPLAIGRTNRIPPFSFDHNTIVLRPRLLKDFNFDAFSSAGGVKVDPIVEILMPEKGKPPRQAKITIPLTKMQGAESYGVIVTLGWHDPANVQAAKVRHVTVRLNSLKPQQERDNPVADVEPLITSFMGNLVEDVLKSPVPELGFEPLDAFVDLLVKPFVGIVKVVTIAVMAVAKEAVSLARLEKEEWLLRVCVNGRWAVFHRKIKVGDTFNLNRTIELFLDEKDRIDISLNGGEIDDIGEVLHEARSSRALKQNDQPVSWAAIAALNNDVATRRRFILAYILKMMKTWGNENEPLGIIDPRIDPSLRITDYNYGVENKNPLWMDDKPHPMGANASAVGAKVGASATLQLAAHFAKAVAGSQCVYVEDPTKEDYVLFYDVSVAAQNLPKDASTTAKAG